MKNRILITGCQRSGTTLMGLIMDSHPDIINVDENEFHKEDLEAYENSTSKSNISFRLSRESANIDFIMNELKPSIVIWMVRDPRDVIASMVNLHMKVNRFVSVAWAARYADTEIIRMLERYPKAILREFSAEIERYQLISTIPSIMRNSHQIFTVAATCWTLKQQSLRLFNQNSIRFSIVKYEDLVVNPKGSLIKIMADTGVAWSDDVLRHHEIHTGTSVGGTSNARSIDTASLNKWRNTIGKPMHDVIEKNCSSTAEKFDYDISWKDK